jgi:hypothetical protein
MQSFDAIESKAFAGLTVQLNDAVNVLIDEIRSELAGQGHNLTGSLSRSLTAKVFTEANSLIAEVEMLAYGKVQNDGVKASRIPFGRASSGNIGRTSLFIQALQKWVKDRGIQQNDALALRIAFAIAKTMKKEGMPTRGSKKFSKNGRRKGFLNVATSRGTGRLTKGVAAAGQQYIGELIDGLLFEVGQEFENIFIL